MYSIFTTHQNHIPRSVKNFGLPNLMARTSLERIRFGKEIPDQFTNWPLLKQRLQKAILPLTIKNIEGINGFKGDQGHFAKAVITKEDYPCPIDRGRYYPNFYTIRIYRHENDNKPHRSWALDASCGGYVSTFNGEVSCNLGSGGPFFVNKNDDIPIRNLLYQTLAKAGLLDD